QGFLKVGLVAQKAGGGLVGRSPTRKPRTPASAEASTRAENSRAGQRRLTGPAGWALSGARLAYFLRPVVDLIHSDAEVGHLIEDIVLVGIELEPAAVVGPLAHD